jgi:predicted Zn-dependent protease
MSLKYSRTQEESADILAIEYLKKLQISNNGLLEIMQYFNQQSQGLIGQINQYDLTHPISSSRILFIKNNNFVIKNNSKKHQKLTKKLHEVQAKLKGFLDNPEVAIKYLNNNSYEQLLTKAILFHRINKFDESIKIIDLLIKDNKNNGFLYELKADFLFSQNLLSSAIINYQTAIKLLSNKAGVMSRINMVVAILQITNDDKYLHSDCDE